MHMALDGLVYELTSTEELYPMRRAVSSYEVYGYGRRTTTSTSTASVGSPPKMKLAEGTDKDDDDDDDVLVLDEADGSTAEVVLRRRHRTVSSSSTRSGGSRRDGSAAKARRRRRSMAVVWKYASRSQSMFLGKDSKGSGSTAVSNRLSLPQMALNLFRRKSTASSSSSDVDSAGKSASATEHAAVHDPDVEDMMSSGNLSSTKSAPATPVGERLQAAPATTSGTTRRRAPGPPTVAPSVSTPTLVPLPSPATSKARHKKFHRHFDSVAPDERVLNYYSCALISDILLQGHLYITSNYFAFYSNVFGYVTKVLIPTASVLKVSKEKTARIIPNAVGVATSDEKHVFGSLLSRDNTYKLMVQVWKTALGSGGHQPSLSPQPLARALPIAKDLKDEADSASASGDVLQEDDDSSLSGDAGLPPVPLDKIPIVAATCPVPRTASVVTAVAAAPGVAHAHAHAAAAGPGLGLGLHDTQWGRSPRQTFVLTVSTVLVAFLLVSTAFLYHRMSRIQDQFRINSGDNLYQDLARWQNHLHTRSAGQVEEFLNTHLDQLAKVRKSLEALTMLIVSNDEDRMQQADGIIHQHHSTYQDQKHHTRPPSLGKDAKES